MSHALLRFSFNAELLKASAVELFNFNGLIFWWWPKASYMYLIQMAVLQFRKIPDVSASTAEETTCLSNWHSIWIGPFNLGLGLPEP